MILILTSGLDYSADLVVRQLMDRGASYVRLNVDDHLLGTRCVLRPELDCTLDVAHDGAATIRLRDVRSVYFRCGTSVTNFRPSDTEPFSNLAATQWNAFVRALELFATAKWMNRPSSIYLAEQKPIQLQMASRFGFDVPPSIVTNDARSATEHARTWACDFVVVKSLDTALLCDGERELFAYSEFVPVGELAGIDIQGAPVIVQRAITPKADLRVTVVGDRVFCVRITEADRDIHGDWRQRHAHAAFTPYTIPEALALRCRDIVRAFGLEFGAIDLADDGQRTWFLELNPTGEWGWLVTTAGQAIDASIADALTAHDRT